MRTSTTSLKPILKLILIHNLAQDRNTPKIERRSLSQSLFTSRNCGEICAPERMERRREYEYVRLRPFIPNIAVSLSGFAAALTMFSTEIEKMLNTHLTGIN